jgi:signal transduction histidine kinase
MVTQQTIIPYKKTSLKNLLLIHELAFILLIMLVASMGAFGIHLQNKSSQESSRISSIVQEVQQTRGDLYRQMKELFDAYFLKDIEARNEYNNFTRVVEEHFVQLLRIAEGSAEKSAIKELHAGYKAFVAETSVLFDKESDISGDELNKIFNTDLESGLFQHYEKILANTEQLLNEKQAELEIKIADSKRKANFMLFTPLILAVLLLLFSRVFLKRSIVKPIEDVLKATAEISAGNLSHKAPEESIAELASLSRAINDMAEKLMISQENLVRTEKQAAQGLLVPMLAHNIRNPLASIRATAQVLDDPALDKDTRESLKAIINTVDRLERWTGALLAYLHPMKPQLGITSIREIVEGALDPLQQRLQAKSITLNLPNWTALHKSYDPIFTDQHLLEQVIYNLVLNAIDASNKGGVITINLITQAHHFILEIIDNGTGMPFIPDPGAVSAPSTKRFGTGIGIPFAFKVCDALNGDLQFSNNPLGGTKISMHLPKTIAIND